MRTIRLTLGILIMIPLLAHGQPDDWKLETAKDGVNIYSKISDCSDPANGTFREYLLLKVVNTNRHEVTVTFDRWAWFDGKCHNCDKATEEYRTSLHLESGSEVRGTCESKDKNLKVFSRMQDMPHVAQLTRFEVGNPDVKPQIPSR